MSTFRHTPDDLIIIDDLIMPLSFFVVQEVAYEIPNGMITQNYVQGENYSASNGKTQVFYSIPWSEGDGYIDNKSIYEAAYNSYLAEQALPQTLGEAKILKINELSNYREGKRAEGIIYNSIDYKSDLNIYNEIFHDHELSLRAEALPSGYYIWRLNETKDTGLTLADLTGVVDKMQEFYWKLRENYDTHRIAIDALGTIALVLAYDFTTGWPTTPYI